MFDVVRDAVVIGRKPGLIAVGATAVMMTFARERAMMLAARQFVQTLSRHRRYAIDGQQRRRQDGPHRGRHRDETPAPTAPQKTQLQYNCKCDRIVIEPRGTVKFILDESAGGE
jgi:hypothetical protein